MMNELYIDEALSYSVIWWCSIDEVKRTALLNDLFPLTFCYNSGKIENPEITLHDTREIFENGRVISFTGSVRTLFEISNLKEAWMMALDLVSSKRPFTQEALLSVHKTLTRGTYDERRWESGERPGCFKRAEYIVGDDVGYSASDVPAAIESLLEEINEFFQKEGTSHEQVLTASCYAHAMLAEIHPFADGNGRTARLLQNMILLNGGMPPLVIDESDRMAYFAALDSFHVDGRLEDMRGFCAASLLKTWDTEISHFLEREASVELDRAHSVPGLISFRKDCCAER